MLIQQPPEEYYLHFLFVYTIEYEYNRSSLQDIQP